MTVIKNCKHHGDTEHYETHGIYKKGPKIGKSYYHTECKLCSNARSKAARLKHPGRSTEYSRQWRLNPENEKKSKAWVDKNRAKINARNKDKSVRMRLQVLTHYAKNGVLACECCNEDHIKFLALDHKFGGGNKHRKELGSSISIYRWTIKNNFPDIFRILCHNCNFAEAHGGCPHKKQDLEDKDSGSENEN